ncbi:gene transfer agent family protein [Nitratireductor sp. StC3]|uniref:gene transfer agent family protein n=1 Tax=Nitratireductor sp. StC3 TaxID=2126741 RepID=UPI000D0DEA52|nr:gene transfer agent family protein [Nitratireductor sp. StC3]PSM16126.1 gene transfer agent family protein [Nitratireductor sp. StC3]
MNEAPAFRTFFGDAERDFRLPAELVLELERVTGAGIAGLYRRFASLDFRHAELLAVIRLGLIGGGETPQTAADLVAAYVTPRPIMEVLPFALGTLEMRLFGKVQSDDE